MKIVVISDTHGLRDVMSKVRLEHPDADAYLHLGDSELTEHELDGFVGVLGNMDYYDFPVERIIEVGDIRIYMTHSHLFSSSKRMRQLVDRAKQHDCTMALFGHTHRFFYEEIEGVTCVNPGSLRYNRDGSAPSYAVIEMDEDHKLSVTRINVEKQLLQGF